MSNTMFLICIILNTLLSAQCLRGLATGSDAPPIGDDIERVCNGEKVNGDPERLICVCNEQTCPDIQILLPNKVGESILVQSSMAGKRFHTSATSETIFDGNLEENKIIVELSEERQSILGWGGAFTDSATMNINKLSPRLSKKLIESYYGKNGLSYNIGRVPIAGSDFSTRSYSYDDSLEPDYNLTNWSLQSEDLQFKIPAILEAKKLVEESGEELKLFGSTWSAPKWMKDNKSFVRGHLIDDDRIYSSYVEYLMKFYGAYDEAGLKFWGTTVQNEPVASYLPFYYFNSMQYDNKQMAKFISEYLGPALEERGLGKDRFKLMVGDDSLGFINYQVPSLLEDPEVAKYVSGVAFHWYTSGLVVPYSHLSNLHEKFGDKIEFLMMSEACAGSNPTDTKKVDLGSWQRGEAYGMDIINDLARYTGAWVDWNLALDLKGGPNWSGNFVDSPIIVNGDKNEFYLQPMYYILGHFSRFLRPGSVVVQSELSRGSWHFMSDMFVIATHDKKLGYVVVNVLNTSGSPKSIDLTINANASKRAGNKFVVDARSISSFIIKS